MSAAVIGGPRSSIEQALQAVASSAEAQQTVLEQCLESIDSHLPAAGPGWVPSSEEQWWWLLRRLDTLRQYDRIATAMKLGQGYAYSAEWMI